MRLSIYCILSIAGTLGVGRCAVDRIVAFGGALTSDERGTARSPDRCHSTAELCCVSLSAVLSAGTTYYAEFLNITDVLPRSPYFDGRWSDGLPYIVHTAQLLGIPLEDYAVVRCCSDGENTCSGLRHNSVRQRLCSVQLIWSCQVLAGTGLRRPSPKVLSTATRTLKTPTHPPVHKCREAPRQGLLRAMQGQASAWLAQSPCQACLIRCCMHQLAQVWVHAV